MKHQLIKISCFTPLRKFPFILLLTLFTVSTLLMPYSNFGDTKLLQIVDNTCLGNDADMNGMEFIGEKLLSFLLLQNTKILSPKLYI